MHHPVNQRPTWSSYNSEDIVQITQEAYYWVSNWEFLLSFLTVRAASGYMPCPSSPESLCSIIWGSFYLSHLEFHMPALKFSTCCQKVENITEGEGHLAITTVDQSPICLPIVFPCIFLQLSPVSYPLLKRNLRIRRNLYVHLSVFLREVAVVFLSLPLRSQLWTSSWSSFTVSALPLHIGS